LIDMQEQSFSASLRLRNKVAIVTGSGAGIGKAIALRYACEGAKVVIAEIDAAAGQATAGQIRDSQREALFLNTDVAQERAVREMVDATVQAFGRIDILVNNAAILLYGKDTRVHELSREVWDRTLAVNLTGQWLCAKHVIPVMLRQGCGCIINLASPTGLRGFGRLTAYSASKGGVSALTRALAADYSADHIRVNAIIPGTIDTPMNAAGLANAAFRQQLIEKAPAGRIGTANDVAGLAVFLATDEANYCVGGEYLVDGGMMAV
jgi:NAD(P)-dependent dehydrogenase (short-subunit alcohol dehydrogenase family)